MGNKLSLTFVQAKREYHRQNASPEYWVYEKKDSFSIELEKIVNVHVGSWDLQSSGPNLEILIGVVDNQMLEDYKVFDKLVTESGFRRVSNTLSRGLPDDFQPKPMICIGIDDLMEVQQNTNNEGTSKDNDGSTTRSTLLLNTIHERIDPRFRILDSSIWHRYVSLIPIETFEERLKNTVKDILVYHDRGLYRSIVGQEYLEFQCRKLQNSYVMNYPGGHAKKVTPFRFHSESKMKELADEMYKGIKHHRWSCLMVDDYASRHLRATGESVSQIVKKLNWISELINRDSDTFVEFLNQKNPFDHYPDRRPPQGFLTYYHQRLEALETVQEKRPDIVILDYFFGIEEMNNEEQYGHKFMKKLQQQPQKHQMAFGKYWIFLISAFEHAFQSHRRLMGDSKGHEFIEYEEGADPINSPELFRYLFYSFLKYQKEQAGLSLVQLAKKMIHLSPDIEERTYIAMNYNRIVDVTTRILRLKEEYTKSPFAESSLQLLEKQGLTKGVLVHLQQLFWFLAYGSSWDWGRMWREYQMVKDMKMQIAGKHPELAEELIPSELLTFAEQHIQYIYQSTQ